MATLATETTRAAGWLSGQKWALAEPQGYEDFRPKSDIRQIRRMLREVPTELLEGVVATLVADATVTSPMTEGKVWDGSWTHCRLWWNRAGVGEDDHKLTLFQLLIKGAGTTAGQVMENGCAYLVTQTFYWDVAALPVVTAGTSGVEYTLASVSRDPETGRYSCILEKREQITQTIPLYVTEQGAAEQTSEQQFLGVRTDDKDHTGAAVGLQDMTLEAGKIKTRRRRKNKNCTQDIEEQSRLGIDQTATDYTKGHAEDATEAKHTQGAVIADPAAPAAGTLLEVVQEPTLFGKLRTILRTRTAKNQTATSWQKNHAETVADALATQDAAGTEPAAPAVGTVVELDQEPTLFGLFRKRARTRTAVDQTATDYTKGHAEDATEAKHTQGTVIADPAAPAAGTLLEVVQEPTLFGKLRTILRTRTAKNQTATSWQKNHAETVADALATQDTAATEPSAPAAGTVIEVEQEPTLFGLFRKRARTRTAVDQTATDYTKGHAEDATEAKHTQGTVIADPAAPAAGTLLEVVQEPTLFGKLRTILRTRTAKNQTATSWQKNHAETVADALATQDTAATEPSAPAAGTVIEVEQEPTLFGLFRKRARTRTAVDQTATDYTKGHAEDATEAKHTQGTVIADPAAPAAGTLLEVVQEPTLFGKLRTILRTRTAKNQTATSWQKTHAETVADALATQDTAATEPSAPAAGTVIEVDQEPTLFGLFRKRSRTRTAVAQAWSISFRTFNGRWGTMTNRWWSHQALGYGEAQFGGAGGVKSISAQEDDFGKESGGSSQFVPDVEIESDAIPVGLETIPCSEVRVKDQEDYAGSITTKKQTVTFNRYEGYAQTVAEALELVGDMENLADYAISSFTTATGDRMYKVTGRTVPLTFSAWSSV